MMDSIKAVNNARTNVKHAPDIKHFVYLALVQIDISKVIIACIS